VAPENTIAAFARAMRDGADGIEFDVRLASDGVPVVIHDDTLHRTAGIAGSVSDFTSAALKEIDGGSWFNHQHPEFARQEYSQETVPTLERVFDLFAGTGGILYLEMKSDKHQAEALAAAVVRLLQEYSFADRVIVESFNLSSLEEVKRLNADLRTAALFEPRLERPASLLRKMKTVAQAIQAGANEIALHYSLASKQVVHKAAQSGLRVVIWTVDNPTWLKRAHTLGIHALITNDPAIMVDERARLFGV
jgi:glycerophosphoryl diester phosphodiesterase